MSGVQMAMMGAGGTVIAFDIATINDFRGIPTTAIGAVTLTSAGAITYTGNAASGTPNWATPNQAGIGSFYWAKLTVNSGTAPGAGTVGSPVALSGSPGWTWTSTSGQVKNANCTIQIYADAAGTNLVAQDTFTVDVEST